MEKGKKANLGRKVPFKVPRLKESKKKIYIVHRLTHSPLPPPRMSGKVEAARPEAAPFLAHSALLASICPLRTDDASVEVAAAEAARAWWTASKSLWKAMSPAAWSPTTCLANTDSGMSDSGSPVHPPEEDKRQKSMQFTTTIYTRVSRISEYSNTEGSFLYYNID